MPEIDPLAPKTSTLKIGESIKMTEPSKEAPPSTGDITSAAKNNEEPSPFIETAETQVEAAPQEEEKDDSYQSGAIKARKIGERQRKFAQQSLDNVFRHPEDRESFIKNVQSDPELEKYYHKHFSERWSELLKTPETLNKEDGDTNKQQIRLELLAEDIRAEKEDQVLDLAKKLKFTQLEADSLKELAPSFEGKKVNGKELDWEDSLKYAARLIRPDKAKVGLTSLPSGKGAERDPATLTKAEHERLVDSYRDVTGIRRDRNKMLKNLETVEKGWNAKENKFVMPL